MIYDELRFLHQNRYFPSPKIMQIEITSICPLHCPQCYTDDLKSNVMDVEQYFRIIEEAKNIGVGAITLLGGEPFTHPHICEMINALDKTGIIGGTYTSGYGLNDDVISTLKNVKNPFYLFLSLNGSTKQVHELSRDEFNLTFNSMKYLKEQHVDYIINWVARHDNIGDLCNVITLSKMYGAKYLNVVCNKINTYGVVESPMSREDYKVLKELLAYRKTGTF